MPRFKLQEAYPLHSSVLPAMGMQASFAPSYDWKPLNGGKHQMYISGVFHSAMIDVNESGTEAAAATAIVVPKEMACMSRGLRLDRPFAFAIEHTKTGHILFAGHVANPFRAKP
jgi:serpin B